LTIVLLGAPCVLGGERLVGVDPGRITKLWPGRNKISKRREMILVAILGWAGVPRWNGFSFGLTRIVNSVAEFC